MLPRSGAPPGRNRGDPDRLDEAKTLIIYIAAREPVEKRRVIARTFGLEPEAIRCDGCRSGIRFSYCSTCKVAACAAGRGIDFCGSCQYYPCGQLKEFQNAYPHRLELW